MIKNKFILISLLIIIGCSNSFGQVNSVNKANDTIASIRLLQVKDTTFYIKPKNDSIVTILMPKEKKVQITLKHIKIDTTSPAWYAKLSLRQSFQNKNDKAEPAYVTLIFPKDSASSQNFSFALGYNVLSGRGEMSLNPFIEWQKNNLSDKEQNAFLAGLNFQTPLWKIFDVDMNKIKAWTVYTIATLNYKHDSEKKTEGTQASLYFTPSFAGKDKAITLLPDVFSNNSVLDYYYNIYGGFEYENRSQVSDPSYKGTTGRWYLRITGTFYPLPKILDKRLEVVPDFTHRNAFSNTSVVEERINNLTKLSVNFVIVSKEKSKFADVKLGFEYKKGCDPTVGFDKQRINTLVLKIKI
ncbi:hypothetical protein ACFFLS_20800 [Flavobacterium procerum]|uniref:Uncharacterized protein n=1 Tax=Flavobacterium procerum TaxID=1455569 RepID=A0ABV6BWX7_9FLAO